MPFERVAVDVSFAPVSVCQRVNVVRSLFCHPHVSFLTKPLFTTLNLILPVTVYNVKSVNSSHHIRRVFPSVHCSTSVMPCAIWYHLFNLKNVISLTQPTQYILVLSIFTEIVLFFLAFLKFLK